MLLKDLIFLTSNSSWYLYNFRRSTIQAFCKRGSRVVCLSPLDSFSSQLVDELGAEHIALPLSGKNTGGAQEMCSFIFILKTMKQYRPDYVFNFTIKMNIYSGLSCRVLGIPYANNVSGLGTAFLHDSWLFRRVRSLYGFANRGAQCVFFQNQEDHDLFVSHGLLRNTPTQVLPGSGINTQRFIFSPLPETPPFTFVMIARLLGDKGVREYVQAAEQVRVEHPNVRFMLIGPYGASNRTAISEAEVTKWQSAGVIDYLGEQVDVRPFIKQAHVLVLPSYREGMPRTVLEAAAMGRPAIVTDVPGCRQAIQAGVTGWFCEVKNTDSLAKSMADCLLMPPGELQLAGEHARRRIEDHFDERIVIAAALKCLSHYA